LKSKLLKKFWLWLLRLAAGFVIVLALLVGVARLLLPEASRFADDVRRIALEVSGFEVDFELLSAGISLYGPELRLTGVTVNWPEGQQAFAAGEIAVALNVYEFVTTRTVAPSLLHVEDMQLEVQINAAGELLLQGRLWKDYLNDGSDKPRISNVRVSLENLRLGFRDDLRGIQPIDTTLHQLFAVLDDDQVEIEVEIWPEAEFGRSLELEGLVPVQLLLNPEELPPDRKWRLRALAEDFRLDPWLKLANIANTPVIGSEGTAEAVIEFTGLTPVMVQTEVDIEQLVLAQPSGEPAVYDSLAGSLSWERQQQGWQAEGNKLRLASGGRRWPESEFTLEYNAVSAQHRRLAADASFLRLEDLMPLLRAFAGDRLAEFGIHGSASGDLWRFNIAAGLQDERVADFAVEADFERLGYLDEQGERIEVAGLSGHVKADEDGGTVKLATRDARVGWERLFSAVIPVTSLEGLALWRSGDEFRLMANDLYLQTPDGEASASLELVSDKEFKNPVIDLSAEASMSDATQVDLYLPNTLPDKALDWVDRAVVSGRSERTDFTLSGPLRKFPFRNDEGRFLIDISFTDGGLEYAPGWPAIEKASGHLIFDNESMYSTENRATLGGIEVRNADVRIEDLKQPQIVLAAKGEAGADKIVAFLQNSPVAKKMGPVFADVRAEGAAAASVKLEIPLRNLADWKFRGQVDIADTSVWLTGLAPRLTEISGHLDIENIYVSADRLSGQLLDEPVDISIEANPAADANFSNRASVSGSFPYERLEAELGLPQLGKLSGRTEIKVAAMFPAPGEDSLPFRLLLHSDLQGVASALPHPLTKAAAEVELFDAEILFPQSGYIDARISLQRGLHADLDYRRRGQRWAITGGLAQFGIQTNAPPGEGGVAIHGFIDQLDIDEWAIAFAEPKQGGTAAWPEGRGRWQDLFTRADLMVSDLRVLGFSFRDTDVRAEFGGSAWNVNLIGPWLEGRILVPYQFDASQTIEAELARMLLIEPLETAAESAADEEYTSSPVGLPGFRGTVNEFALVDMRLGQLEADVRSVAKGLEAAELTLSSPSFSATLSGDWLEVDSAQRSRLHLELESSDMLTTLDELGYAPLISASRGSMVADLLWEGAPGLAAVGESTGTVSMTIREGFINDIDAGGGRLLGLLSVASLPRRLALDFTDLTEEKLQFRKISGDFRIDFGDAWTCNLGMEGEVADMALVGRTGINAQDYNQVAVVRPHVSNLMPVPAAFLGGPAVGMAALLVAQIFKKPLSGIGESYYTIQGSWEDSEIVSAQRSELDTTPFADCENQLPALSPEELAAIQELINQSRQPADASATDVSDTSTTENNTSVTP